MSLGLLIGFLLMGLQGGCFCVSKGPFQSVSQAYLEAPSSVDAYKPAGDQGCL